VTAAELATALLLAFLPVFAADAPSLAVRGERLTVNGDPRFLVFISYADGIRRIPDSLDSTTVLDADFDYFVRKKIAGVRVFPNWHFRSETLMQCDGTLRPLQRDKLVKFAARAAAKNLIVDATFTIDTVRDETGRQCLSAGGYNRGLQLATDALRPYRNALFDLQNEHDKNLPPPDDAHRNGWTAAEWAGYLAQTMAPAIRTRDASRLLTVSWTSDAPVTAVRDEARIANWDLVAYHNRGTNWVSNTSERVTALRKLSAAAGAARPIYLQEPNRFPFDTNASHYEAALRNAVRAGAAAWTFHNSIVERSKPLNGTVAFETLLEPGERTFVDRIAAALP